MNFKCENHKQKADAVGHLLFLQRLLKEQTNEILYHVNCAKYVEICM